MQQEITTELNNFNRTRNRLDTGSFYVLIVVATISIGAFAAILIY